MFSAQNEEPDLDHFDLDLPSVQMAIDELRARVAETVDTSFDDLVSHCTRRVEIAAYFLAVLELARWGMIEVAQELWLDEIRVRQLDVGQQMTSEWAS